MFAVLHDPNDTSLAHGYKQRSVLDESSELLVLTSVWYFRSSSTRSLVSLRSSAFSTRETTVLILSLYSGAEKSRLNEKESERLTSLPGGCFFRILNFAHARDCKDRCSSTSGIAVAALISCKYA